MPKKKKKDRKKKKNGCDVDVDKGSEPLMKRQKIENETAIPMNSQPNETSAVQEEKEQTMLISIGRGPVTGDRKQSNSSSYVSGSSS